MPRTKDKNYFINKNGQYWDIVLKKCNGNVKRAEAEIRRSRLISGFSFFGYIAEGNKKQRRA